MWIRTSYEASSHAEEEQFMNLDTGCLIHLAVSSDNQHMGKVLFPGKHEVKVSGESAISLRILMYQCVESTKEAVGLKENAA